MEQKKIKVLVGSLSRDFGGVESFFLTHLHYLDDSKYEMNFLCTDRSAAREKEFLEAGAEVFHIDRPGKRLFQYIKRLWEIFKTGKYDIYHVNLTRYRLPLDLLLARVCGTKVVLHSHSTQIYKAPSKEIDYLRHIEQKLFKYPTIILGNKRIACCKAAANYLFGSRKTSILYNGIELEKYYFSYEIRKKIRKQMGLEDNFVIGHIGRFSPEKNHKFLLRVLKLCLEHDSRIKVLCIGEGDLFDNILTYAKKLGVENNLICTGVRSDVQFILSAMDVFCFPSLHEALPITLIEAQANGLKCLVSDVVTKEIKYTSNVIFLSTKKAEEIWMREIIDMKKNYIDRDQDYYIENSSRFSICSSIKELQKTYNEIALEDK